MDFGISSVSLSTTQKQQKEEESQPPLKVFVSQFPIRALPSNDSDFQTSIYIHDDQPFQLSSSCSYSSSNSDQSGGFLSGDEEFDEIETTFVVDPNEVSFSDSLPAKILMPPKARVSLEDDDGGFVSDVEEDGFFSSVVRVSTTVGGLWEFDNIVGIPKVRVLSSDKEEVDEETYEDGVPGIDFMGNCKINDEVISSNGILVANTGKDVLGIVSEEELLIENIPILDSLVVEGVNVIFEERSAVVVGVQEQGVIEVKEKINESLGVNVDCSNGGDSVFDNTGVEETEVSDVHCEDDVPVGKDMVVLLIDQLDVNPVVKELVDSNFGCMNVSSMNEGGSFVEVKKICLPGLDTSQIEENEFYENKATEVLVIKTSMRLGIQPDQELFDQDSEDEVNSDRDNGKELEGSISDEDAEVVKCDDGYENFEEIVRESVQGSGVNHPLGAESSRDHSHKNNGHMSMEFDKEVLDTDDIGDDRKDLLDLSMLAALPNAASTVSHRGNIGMTSLDGLIISPVKHSASLGPSIISLQPTPRPTQSNCVPTEIKLGEEFEENMTAEAKKRLDTINLMRVKFLRLLQRLGHSPEDTTAKQVLHQLILATGRRTSQAFGLETARRTALQLDAEGKDDLNLSLNVLVLGVG